MLISDRYPENAPVSRKHLDFLNKVEILFSLVANNRIGPLIGQTIVLTSGKNRLTNQDRISPVRDDFYLSAC